MKLQSQNSDLETILQFKNSYPWKPSFPDPLVKKFLTDFISSPQMIFEFADEQGIAGVAVALDRVETVANDVCLEILGVRSNIDPMNFVKKLIMVVENRIPPTRAGFQISFSENLELDREFFKANKIEHYFDTYEMHRSHAKAFPLNVHPQICLASPADQLEIYAMLCDSFSESKDTAIPDYESWSVGFLKTENSHFFLWKEDGYILGFATLFPTDGNSGAEIRTIGVSKKYRGRGIGRKLLEKCVAVSDELGLSGCHLTVSVSNSRALELYLRAGFKVTGKMICYRKDLVR